MTRLFLATLLLAFTVDAQRRRGPRQNPDGTLKDNPFKGIFFNGQAPKDLFPIQQTGVSTERVRKAAVDFLGSLNAEQRKATVFPVDDIEWRKWDNRHFYTRQGLGFEDMSQVQRDRAFGLLRASLSARGLAQSQDIMKLNGTLEELVQRPGYGEWLYWITIMGEPSTDKPWGWQIDGHHLIINYLVLGDQVVMSPVFMGSEPVTAKAGKFAGAVVCQEEQDLGLAMITALDDAQRAKAIVKPQKDGSNNVAESFRDNQNLDLIGIAAKDLKPVQRTQLLKLIAVYVGHMRDPHAKVKMSAVQAHLDDTYFGWMGGTEPDSVFYYRIQSPVLLIEFDHQRPIALSRSQIPTREHIHTVVRTPNGNDYGKDLLRQHHHHHHHE